MKTLLAIRHAKSGWDDPGLADHDRPLNKRGLRDAPEMGDRLSSMGLHPDIMLTSTANRAQTTALIIAEALSFPGDSILKKPSIYEATAPALLKIVQKIDEDATTAMIFGHNPGMHEFASELLRKKDAKDLKDFPTLAIAWMELDVEHWGEAEWGCARLIHFLRP